jgi:hypothetical protein
MEDMGASACQGFLLACQPWQMLDPLDHLGLPTRTAMFSATNVRKQCNTSWLIAPLHIRCGSRRYLGFVPLVCHKARSSKKMVVYSQNCDALAAAQRLSIHQAPHILHAVETREWVHLWRSKAKLQRSTRDDQGWGWPLGTGRSLRS